MQQQPVDLIEREVAFQGYFRVDRYRLRHALHDGGMGPVVTREVLERGQVAALLPVDAAREKVVLVEQFRIGAYAAGRQPWLLECVAGVIEHGESAEDMCRREALEESGCTVLDLLPIARFFTSPGACSESVALFCGRVDASGATGIHGLADEGEDIKVASFGFDEAISMLEQGRIVNAKTIIALQWLAMNRDRVREQWG